LLEQFVEERDGSVFGVKWALANAIGFLLDENSIEDIRNLILDKRHGESRVAIVEALGELNGEESLGLLQVLKKDRQLRESVDSAIFINRNNSTKA